MAMIKYLILLLTIHQTSTSTHTQNTQQTLEGTLIINTTSMLQQQKKFSLRKTPDFPPSCQNDY